MTATSKLGSESRSIHESRAHAARLFHARDALCQLYVDGRSLAWVLAVPLRGAMEKVGELWHAQGDGIGIEHRAMEICSRAVDELRAMVPLAKTPGPWAVGGGPPGDPYLLPSRCAAAVLAQAGWQTVNLGADVPWDQFGAMARRYEAKLVWLSVTGRPEKGLAGRIEALAGELAQLGAVLVVGGARCRRWECPRTWRIRILWRIWPV